MRTRHDRYLLRLWLARWGFAVLVVLAMIAGATAAVGVPLPDDVPSVALQAGVLYRVEIGLAVFLAFYLVIIALALALHNRGFTDVGTSGVRAQDLDAVSRGDGLQEATMEVIEELMGEVSDLRMWREEAQRVR
jgi:hypothetical protein